LTRVQNACRALPPPDVVVCFFFFWLAAAFFSARVCGGVNVLAHAVLGRNDIYRQHQYKLNDAAVFPRPCAKLNRCDFAKHASSISSFSIWYHVVMVESQ
jgi:hypothetical protein